ncbi:MAG: indolepyruvate oxidoreductase subunit beta [Phycisphaerae bacterium]|nr:indolepyruvate oxidoreductase subunit beta [Phycisphaerae bacterium]
MIKNTVLAGVGGQGILSIAYCICKAALNRDYQIKQSEVHGMAQRGGNVESHVRFSDDSIPSGLIPQGKADVIIAVEPVEALRHENYLKPDGCIVSSISPIKNFNNYPDPKKLLERIAQAKDHVLLNSKHLAKVAGNPRVENIIILGAASDRLGLGLNEFDTVLEELFSAKGEKVVQANQRALRIGRRAAEIYRESLAKGQGPHTALEHLEQLPENAWDPEAATPGKGG